MITFGAGHRYYLYRGFVDMRKSFDSLSGLVTNELGRQATSGEVYIFVNRRRDQVKLLVWDRSGFVIYYKRLEKGTFEMPRVEEAEKEKAKSVAWAELLLILEGISLSSARWRKRYMRMENVEKKLG